MAFIGQQVVQAMVCIGYWSEDLKIRFVYQRFDSEDLFNKFATVCFFEEFIDSVLISSADVACKTWEGIGNFAKN